MTAKSHANYTRNLVDSEYGKISARHVHNITDPDSKISLAKFPCIVMKINYLPRCFGEKETQKMSLD